MLRISFQRNDEPILTGKVENVKGDSLVGGFVGKKIKFGDLILALAGENIFKGTGNMEIRLDRKLTDKRIFPSVNINLSGTRKEELLVPADVLNRIWILRKLLSPLSPLDSMEFLLNKLQGTKNNEEFLAAMNR